MPASLNRRHVISLAGAAAAGLAFAGNASAQARSAEASVDAAKLAEPGKMKDMVYGKADAPVTIVEYASLTCSHCADFAVNTFPIIKEKYIDTGKAKLIFREFPFDPRATAAFMLARCAPEDRYFPMIEVFLSSSNSGLVQPMAKLHCSRSRNLQVLHRSRSRLA